VMVDRPDEAYMEREGRIEGWKRGHEGRRSTCPSRLPDSSIAEASRAPAQAAATCILTTRIS